MIDAIAWVVDCILDVVEYVLPCRGTGFFEDPE
jgi:hypothetical protein